MSDSPLNRSLSLAAAAPLDRLPVRQVEFALPTSSRDLAFILFKWKWSMLAVFLVGLLGSIFWIWVIRDDVYEVSAKVLVKIGHEQTSTTTLVNDHPIPVVGQRAQDVNSEIDILQNKALVGEVVDELHLDVPAPPPPYPTGLFQRLRWHVKDVMTRVREWQNELFIRLGLRPRLTARERVLSLLSDGLLVTAQKDSNVIVARMFVAVREGGSIILNAVIDRYLKYRLTLWRGGATDAFFSSELKRSEQELRGAEAALAAFERDHNIVVLQKQQEVLVASIAEQEERTRHAAIEFEEADAKVRRVAQEGAKPAPDFAGLGQFPEGSFPESAMQQLSALERRREELKLTELDDSIRLRNLRNQFDSVFQGVISNVKAAAAERKAAYDARASALAKMRDELQALHAQEIEWTNLKRRITLAEQNYMNYSAKVRETSALDELEARHIGNVVVIEHATDALRPAGTRKLTLLSACLAVCVLAAFAFMAVGEFFDHRIYSADMLEVITGTQAIVTIPAVKRKRLRQSLRQGLPPAAAQS